MSNKKIVFFFLCPVLLSLLLHLHVFNLDLIGYHVWRQTQTQTVIYHFSHTDNSIFHPQQFDLSSGSPYLFYEFPLYQWLVAQLDNVLGYSVAHSRVFSFLVFVFFLLGFFLLLRRFVSLKNALITNSLLCFSPLLYYYCVNPLPDLMALAFAAWALNFFFEFLSSAKHKHFVLFSLFIALSALVKLPYLLFGGVLVLYLWEQYKSRNYKQIFIYSYIFLLVEVPGIIWYAKAIPTWKGNGITEGLFGSDKSFLQLLDYFQHSLISSAPELLTNYASCAFLVVGIYLFFKQKKYMNKQVQYFICVFVLFTFYFLFELNMIEKTHDYYLMPFVLLIFLVLASGLNYFVGKKGRTFVIFILCLSPLTAWLRIDQRWNLVDPGFTKEYKSKQKEIQNLIPENEICIIDADESKFIALYYLKRYGFSLLKDELNKEVLRKYYDRGANYLVTENEKFNIDDYPDFVFENVLNGNLKIYRLKLK